MFFCRECHSEEKGCLGWDFHPKSRGPCEVCHRVAVCVDCVAYKRVAAERLTVTAAVLAEHPTIRPLEGGPAISV